MPLARWKISQGKAKEKKTFDYHNRKRKVMSDLFLSAGVEFQARKLVAFQKYDSPDQWRKSHVKGVS